MQTLTPRALAEEWAAGKTRPVYYLCGEEAAMKEAALRRLQEAFKPESFNFSVRDAETSDVAQALDEARTAPMLAETRFVAIKRAEKLRKDPLGQVLSYLEDPCPSATLLLLADWPREKQDPIPAALGKDCALVDFSPLTPAQAAERLNSALLARSIKTDRDALDLMVELVGTDSVTLDGEAEKAALYMHGQDRIFGPDDALALTGFARVQNPFELSDSVCRRDAAGAAQAVTKMLDAGSEPLALLSQISRALERLLKVKRLSAAGGGPATAYQAGMSPGQYHAAMKDADRFAEDKLLRSLRRCLEAEELLKSTSRRDPALVIRQLAYEITGTR